NSIMVDAGTVQKQTEHVYIDDIIVLPTMPSGSSQGSTTPPAPAPVANVGVSLNASTLTVGQTTQANATTKDATNNLLTGRTISCSISNTIVAPVSAPGLWTAVAAGTSTITATSEGVTGSSAVTVTTATPVPVATTAVSLASSSLTVGKTTQATATTKDAS